MDSPPAIKPPSKRMSDKFKRRSSCFRIADPEIPLTDSQEDNKNMYKAKLLQEQEAWIRIYKERKQEVLKLESLVGQPNASVDYDMLDDCDKEFLLAATHWSALHESRVKLQNMFTSVIYAYNKLMLRKSREIEPQIEKQRIAIAEMITKNVNKEENNI